MQLFFSFSISIQKLYIFYEHLFAFKSILLFFKLFQISISTFQASFLSHLFLTFIKVFILHIIKASSNCKRLIIYLCIKKVVTSSMSVAEIIIDPIVILQMTGYFEKNCSQSLGGATFGFIYAKQVQLKFLVALAAPLGTNHDSIQQLLSRAETFQKMRKTKSKTTHSYYLEYELLGFYVMRKKFEKEEQKLAQLSVAYAKKGSPYTLSAVVDQSVSITFKKDNKIYPYLYQMQTNQKICIDSYNNQNSKSLVKLTIKKQASMISNYNENVSQLLKKAENKSLSQTQLIELTQILDNYDRIKYLNNQNKMKTLEALNYSVLVGLSVARTLGI